MGKAFCNVSIGVARYPEDGKTVEELLKSIKPCTR